MTDTIKILEAVNNMHASINTSFKSVYDKIDEKFDNCQEIIGDTDDRVTKIEKIIAVKKALCEKKKENEKDKKDFWRPVTLAITIAGVLALLTIAGKLLIFGLIL